MRLTQRFSALTNVLVNTSATRPGVLSRFLLRRPFSEFEGDSLPSRTVLLFHPPQTLRAEIQEACVQAVGERSARIVTPADADHSYVILSSPEVASTFVERGVEFDGITHVVRTNREMNGAERIGVTTTVHVNFGSHIEVDQVVAEAERLAGTASVSHHIPQNNANLVYINFRSPDDAIRIMQAGVVINGEDLRCDYSNPRAERPARSNDGFVPRSYDGDTWTICIRQLPEELSDDEVKSMVREACGKIPVRVNSTMQGPSKLFFVEMQTPAHSRELQTAGLIGPNGQEAILRFQEERRLNSDFYENVYGKTNRILVGAPVGTLGDNMGERVLQAARDIGVTPSDVEMTERNIRFAVESPEAAIKVYEHGLVVDDTAFRVRLVQPDATEPSAEVRLANLPWESTQADVMQAIEQATGVRPQSVSFLMNRAGRPRGLGFATFESPEQATKLVELAPGTIELDGRDLVAKYTRPRPERPRRSESRSFQDTPRVLAASVLVMNTNNHEAVLAALQQNYSMAPKSSSVEGAHVRLDFDSSDSATSVANGGLEVDGEQAYVTFRRSVLNDNLAGQTSALYVSKLNFPVDTDALMEDVAAQTGIRPSHASAPMEKNFLFLTFENPDDASKAAEMGFSHDGRRALIGYSVTKGDKERRQRYD